ncbi:MAG: RNA polymerase sigma factor [Acidobacteria bacterium]|nr:MAG: RNA polymerase sigma factor [Acidobacteriota bacterium]REK07736.1 MAG: RNA polymerase sigma factor [Acidobacteriota bacterium]
MTSTAHRAATDAPDREARYTAIRADLERAVRRVCPAWLRDRQEDLVQVAVLRVMDVQRRSDERGEGNRELGSSYLYRVAYSAMIDEIRRIRRRDETDLDGEGPAVIQHTTSAPGPDAVTQASEQGAAIRDCLGHLLAPRRSAVTLYLAGHSVPESARLLGWTLKKTENLVYRGLADLRQCLLGKGIRP